VRVEEHSVERQQVVEHRAPQIRQHALADDRDEIEPGAARQRHHRCDGYRDPAVVADHLQVLLDEALIDNLARQRRDGERSERRRQQEEDRQREPDGIAQDERNQPPQRFQRLGIDALGRSRPAGTVGRGRLPHGAWAHSQGVPDIGGARRASNQIAAWPPASPRRPCEATGFSL
jgi:hypothetical protein